MDKKSGSFVDKLYNIDHNQGTMATSIGKWWEDKRWEHTSRHYTPKDVAALKSSFDLITPSHYQAQKLYSLLRNKFNQAQVSQTYGALDPV